MRISIKTNNTEDGSICPFCCCPADPRIPYWYFVDGSWTVACEDCAKRIDPNLVQMLHEFEGKQGEYDSDWPRAIEPFSVNVPMSFRIWSFFRRLLSRGKRQESEIDIVFQIFQELSKNDKSIHF